MVIVEHVMTFPNLSNFIPVGPVWGISQSFWQWMMVQLWPGDILMCFVCMMTKQHAAFKQKDTISVFPVSSGSVETPIRWGGKMKQFLIAYFLGNTCQKLCKFVLVCHSYSMQHRSHFLRHNVVSQKTGNTEIVSFYLNAACCFVNRHTKHIKISPGHS